MTNHDEIKRGLRIIKLELNPFKYLCSKYIILLKGNEKFWEVVYKPHKLARFVW